MLTGRVTGTVARIVAQEGVPQPFASARVTFLARIGEFPAGTDLVIPDHVTCRLDAQGRILDPTDPEGVRLGVELAASENIEGGFTTVVRIEGPSFTTRVFDIIVRSGETIDIATAVHVPAQPGQVVDRLAGLVDQVQEWVDDPTTLPDVGPAVEAAAGSASAAAESAQQAHAVALAVGGYRGVPLCRVSSGWDECFAGWGVEGAISEHGVQDEDAAVGQCHDRLVVAFAFCAFAVVVGPAGGVGADGGEG